MLRKKKCYCPACKSLLNLQEGFSSKNEKHMCTECGRIINVTTGEFPQDDEEEELYFGDFSVKEGKYDGSDNEKTAPLPKIPQEAPPPQYEDEGELPPPPPPMPEDAPTPPPTEEAPPPAEEEKGGIMDSMRNGLNNWKKSHVKPLMIAKLGLVAVIFILASAFLLSKLTPMGYDSVSLEGMDKRSVSEMLERQGFTRVKTIPLEDLGYDQIDQENIVRSIEIGDITDFKSTKRFLKWKKIKVYYSSLQKKALPISSKDIKDMDYVDLQKMLTSAGFVNIKTEADPDLTTGWIHSAGEVEKVYVNNKEKFSANDQYRPDVEIIIVYHTFK